MTDREAAARPREYIRAGELQNCISGRLREGAENEKEDGEETGNIAFTAMLEAYEALKSDERGSRARRQKKDSCIISLCFCRSRDCLNMLNRMK